MVWVVDAVPEVCEIPITEADDEVEDCLLEVVRFLTVLFVIELEPAMVAIPRVRDWELRPV